MRAALNRLSFRRPSKPHFTQNGSGILIIDKSNAAASAAPLPPLVTSAGGSWPKVGDYVMAKLDDWTRYYGGEVKKWNQEADTFDILFDDGERHRSVQRQQIRRPGELPPSTPSGSVSSEPSATPHTYTAPLHPVARFATGDRVSCKIAGWNSWYDGYVNSINPDLTYVVSFDDGEVVSTVREKEMMPVSVDQAEVNKPPPKQATILPEYIKLNCRLEAKCGGWHKFYLGTVQEISEDRKVCSVMFDDGELKEGITAAMVRPARTKSQAKIRFDLTETVHEDSVLVSTKKLRIGMKVMANPFSEWTKAYSGKIERQLNDGTFAILFDDGERVAGVSADDIDPIANAGASEGPSMEDEDAEEFRIGQNIEAKVGQWRKYYPGKIRKENPDGTFVVDFLDGEVIHEVRVEEMRKSRQRTETTASEVTNRPNSPDQVFRLGERVAAKLFIEQKWRKYWGGEVLRCNEDGSYKIAFDDGEVYTSVWPAEMKRPKPGSALAAPILKAPPPEYFDVGERVEVKTMNWKSWYPGLVEKRNEDDTYIVQFDDGERLLDVKLGELRRLIKVKQRDKTMDSSDEEED